MGNPLYGSNKFDRMLDKSYDSLSDFAMTATHSGGAAASASIKEGLIELRIDDLGSGENCSFTVPFDFEIQDVWIIVPNGENVTSKTYTLRNNTTAVTSAMSGATDKARVAPSTIDTGQTIFRKGDDDLNVLSSAHADGNVRVYIKYEII
tara:strand:- start:60 stop:509 length:450 start_codon:yes stop_codon:yes gene_type:complete